MNQRFIPVGHRGAPREFPPNTMAGFRRAAEIGCAMVECDVRRSSDGAVVLAHDGHVTDASGSVYDIAATDASTLAALDLGAGEGVPTLAELVEWALDAGVAIMADMKTSGAGVEEQVATILARLPPELKIVPGASLDARRIFRAADSYLPLSLSLGRSDMTEQRFQQILDTRDALAIDPLPLSGRYSRKTASAGCTRLACAYSPGPLTMIFAWRVWSNGASTGSFRIARIWLFGWRRFRSPSNEFEAKRPQNSAFADSMRDSDNVNRCACHESSAADFRSICLEFIRWHVGSVSSAGTRCVRVLQSI